MSEKTLTESEQKTKQIIYKIIGRKISESRKSSRRKLEGISKKLNINIEILKIIESGEIEKIEAEIPITGFIRAFAKITNTDIGEELDKLHSNYITNEKPKSIYQQVPSIKVRNIFYVFLSSFCFLLAIIYFLNLNTKTKDEKTSNEKVFSDEDVFKQDQDYENKLNYSQHENDEIKIDKIIKENERFFEIIFLEETWIEIYNDDKNLIRSGLFNVGDNLDFEFKTLESDVYIKSGNLGGFQIFFKDEFFAPFGYSGEVNKGFFLKEKIKRLKKIRL